MGIRVELEMLAVLLLLTPIVSDGLVMPKCQLVEQLMLSVPGRENQVAKIVCHAEMTSNFDTSVIKQITPPNLPGQGKSRGAPKATKPHAKSTTKLPAKPIINPLAKPTTTHPPNTTFPNLVPMLLNITNETMLNSTGQPIVPRSNYSHIDHKMSPPPPPNSNSTYSKHHNKRDVSGLWKLYGVFQLADHVACTSSKKPSFNICNLSCDKLIDVDITDDINCVLTIINSEPNRKTNPAGQVEANRLIRTMNDMIMNTCPNMNYTQYLAECNGP